MQRRELLELLFKITGAPVVAPLAAALPSGCAQTRKVPSVTLMAYKSQFEFISEITNILIPTDNTPGALELGVDSVIFDIVLNTYKKEDALQYFDQVEWLKHWLGENYQHGLGTTIDEKLLVQLENKLDQAPENIKNTYLHLKQQVVAVYLTSEGVAAAQVPINSVMQQNQSCNIYIN